MQIDHRKAARALRQSLSKRSLEVRAHVWGRFASCPFLRTLHHVSAHDRVLDVGTGHGLFALLAIEAGAASVVAVDPDLRKLFRALRHPRIHFVAGFSDAIAGHFDLVSLYDVLYRVPIADRDRLLAILRERLRPGGTLLIKELDPEHRLKSAWNRTQEWVSDTFFGITLGNGLHYETTAQVLQRLRECGYVDAKVESIGAGYPHSHITYTARAAG